MLASDGDDFGTMNIATTNQPYSMIPTPNMNVKLYSLGVFFLLTVKVDFAGSTSSRGSGPPAFLLMPARTPA